MSVYLSLEFIQHGLQLRWLSIEWYSMTSVLFLRINVAHYQVYLLIHPEYSLIILDDTVYDHVNLLSANILHHPAWSNLHDAKCYITSWEICLELRPATFH